ncbi:MAG: hypothetical protein ACOZF0_15470 [Thermodesulfobacteriota bacterium]
MVSKRTIRFVLLLAGVAAVIVYLVVFSAENQVRRVITKACGLVARNANDQPLALAARTNQLKAYLDDELQIHIPSYRFQGLYARQDIAASLLAAFSHAEVISVTVFDLTVEVLPDGEATAGFTAEISRKLRDQVMETDYLQLSCRLRKPSDDWVLYQVEVVEALEK